MGTERAFVSVSPVSGSEAAAVPSTSVHEALTATDSLPAPLLVPTQPRAAPLGRRTPPPSSPSPSWTICRKLWFVPDVCVSCCILKFVFAVGGGGVYQCAALKLRLLF